MYLLLLLLSLSESAGSGRLLPPSLVLFWFLERRWRRGRRELGGGRSREDETLLGGDSGKSGGCLAPDRGEDARSRSRSFCCCLRTACDLSGFVRLCFFPLFSLANCFPCSLAAGLPFPPSSFSSPLLPSLPLSFWVTPGGKKGGCPLARPAGSLPSASVF